MHQDRFAPLPPEKLELWAAFSRWEDAGYFPTLGGVGGGERRTASARMRLPYRPERNQPGGVVHGGAIATLIDTVVVPAISSAYEAAPQMLTISMTIDYLGALRAEDAVAEGWVEKRGKRT